MIPYGQTGDEGNGQGNVKFHLLWTHHPKKSIEVLEHVVQRRDTKLVKNLERWDSKAGVGPVGNRTRTEPQQITPGSADCPKEDAINKSAPYIFLAIAR
ncbi:hypothetical protein BTVI_41754 [Pitangus sulphuratus]|nr:hypothetical protein BTVI_41754 [Pitangus sulphuratus]